MDIIYSTTVSNIGGRKGGRSVSEDGAFAVDIAAPGSLLHPEATNPEQLFAAAYSACFNSALMRVMRDEKITYRESRVTATVHLVQDPDGSKSVAVDLRAAVDDFPQAENQRLADLAHQICPYSKATRGNIPVTVTGE